MVFRVYGLRQKSKKMAEPEKIKNLKIEASETKSPVLYNQIGEYYFNERSTWSKSEKYHMKAMRHGGHPMSAYKLGYIYEKKLGQTNDALIYQAFENKMKRYYILAMNSGAYQACNQLGKFYIHLNEKIEGKTCIELFEIAANKNCLPSITNLITYHPSVNEKFKWAYKKYEITKEENDIKTLIIMSHEYQRPRDYILIGEMIGIDNLENILNGLNLKRSGITEEYCESCSHKERTIPLQCEHYLCHECIFNIKTCPKCPIAV